MKKINVLKSVLISTAVLASFLAVRIQAEELLVSSDDSHQELMAITQAETSVSDEPASQTTSPATEEVSNPASSESASQVTSLAAEEGSNPVNSESASTETIDEEADATESRPSPAVVDQTDSPSQPTDSSNPLSSESNETVGSADTEEGSWQTAGAGAGSAAGESTAPTITVTSGSVAGKINIVNKEDKAGRFDVVITEIATPAGLRQIQIPIWSDSAGQDDLKWYTASKQANASYKVSVNIKDHKFSTGLYHIHLYYNVDGKLRGVTGTTTTIESLAPTGQLTISKQSDETGRFDLLISNVSSQRGVASVVVPVWSDSNGQDDLKWYTANKQADGTYTVSVSIADHKFSTGLYHAHLYYHQLDGSFKGIAGRTLTVKKIKPSGKLDIIQNSGHTVGFEVKISQVVAQEGIKEVVVPVWSDSNGQDDLKWYVATKQADGTYQVLVNASNHKASLGLYHAHLYYRLANGQFKGIAATRTNLQAEAPSLTLSLENINQSSASFDVRLTNVKAPLGIKEIKVPVWGDKFGQNDIVWYTANRQADGSYKASVKAQRHQFEDGLYHVHVYLRQEDNVLRAVGKTTITLNKVPVQTAVTYAGTGTYTLSLKNVAGSGVVSYAVWSDNKGQDDLIWYTAAGSGADFNGHINTQKHLGTGLYHVHVYRKDVAGLTYVSKTQFTVNKSSYSAPYYSQNDGRWANVYYGYANMDSSGCVPTSMAMIFSSLKDQTILPTQVADYLYYSTRDFNKPNAGANSNAIVKSAANWGLTANVITSKNSLAKTLSDGYYVSAAVGASRFVVPGWTHEIVLKGYQNGMTYVLDPDNAKNNGWHSLDYIYSVKSTHPMDNLSGAPFFKINDR